MKTIAVIPARLASTRLPRKMLREIGGKPLIGVVYEAVRASPLLADVIVATDSEEIQGVCREHGWKVQMTSPAHRSGTERVHEISSRETADVYINVQGDEPMVRAVQIATLLRVMENPSARVGTVMTPCAEVDIPNPNAVKVVTDFNGRALYFSRATIPFDRDGARPHYFKHLGLYAYRKPALDKFVVARPVIGELPTPAAVVHGETRAHEIRRPRRCPGRIERRMFEQPDQFRRRARRDGRDPRVHEGHGIGIGHERVRNPPFNGSGVAWRHQGRRFFT